MEIAQKQQLRVIVCLLLIELVAFVLAFYSPVRIWSTSCIMSGFAFLPIVGIAARYDRNGRILITSIVCIGCSLFFLLSLFPYLTYLS